MKSRLRKDILVVLVFTALIPTAVSLVLLLKNVEQQHLQLARLQSNAKQQAQYALSLQMNQIESFAEVLEQSSEISSYIRSPVQLRKYTQILLIGKMLGMIQRLHEISNVAILKNSGAVLFNLNGTPLPPVEAGTHFAYETGAPYIYYFKELLFDDQAQSSPSAIPQGLLLVEINKAKFLSRVPSVTTLLALPRSSDDIQGISIKLRTEKSTSKSVLYYITAISILLFGALFIGIRLLFDRILVPYIQSVEQSNKAVVEKQRAVATAELARQVSHDIRSPLSALNLALTGLENISEDKRVLIRNSVNRIQDIANTLVSQKKLSGHVTVELIPAIIDGLVSEKRTQFREKFKINITTDFQNAYDAFANIDAVELKRVLSNLINNAVEAIDEVGEISVRLRIYKNEIVIAIQDNGKGMPYEVLSVLGKKSITWGKEQSQSGSGLGVLHAKGAIEAMGGSIRFDSKIGQGTIVTITLPRANSPSWFVDRIAIKSEGTIVVVDDDTSIHNIGRTEFEIPMVAIVFEL